MIRLGEYIHWLHQQLNSIRSWFSRSARLLLDGIRSIWKRSQAVLRSGTVQIVHRLRGFPPKIKGWVLRIWYFHRKKLFTIFWVLSIAAAVFFLWRRWLWLDDYLLGLEKTVRPELTIEIGVAITGIIAIAFSLSLFAIQQVAERGTPATLQAYASDRLLKLIYWLLAAFAATSFALALFRTDRNYNTGAAIAALLLLLGSFFLLNIYFKRVVKFADPRHTIQRIYKQGQRQLTALLAIRNSIDAQASKKSPDNTNV